MIEILLEAERNVAAGRLDEANRLYDQALEADPRNSIAVVGLARVALERGHDVDALALARRALAIDPENVAAQRLTARLEEVLAARGTRVPAPAPPSDGPGRAAPRNRRGLLRRLLRRS